MGVRGPIKVFSGNSNLSLASDICEELGVSLGKAEVSRFSDGEVQIDICESVRGADCFLIQSTSNPANEHLMEMLVMVDALKRASAAEVTAVIPYYGYARQDRKVSPRAPISAKLVADLLMAVGVHRVLSMEFHAGQIQGFFDMPVDHLYASPCLLDRLRVVFEKELSEQTVDAPQIAVVSPDAGGVERARAYAKHLGATLAIVDKRRSAPGKSQVMHLVGEVAGKHALIVDDMIDTAGTLTQAAQAVIDEGALSVRAASTHAVLSGPALQRITDSALAEVVVTDTISHENLEERCPKITSLSAAALFAEAISRINSGRSISSLFI